MPRDRTNNATVTLRLPKKAVDWVNEHAKVRGLTASAVYRRALGQYITRILEVEANER